MNHYYIYYRVKDDDAETETHIHAMQTRLACRSNIKGRLLKRRDDPSTWMEIYENVADSINFEHQLARTVSEFDVDMFLTGDGRRVIECFVEDDAPISTPTCSKN
ncbi:MAG: DUF4936 family protein [Sulfuriferula sp.]